MPDMDVIASMQTTTWRTVKGLLAGILLLAGGCASNCNVLSSSHSFACNATMAAMAVPAIPVAMVSEVREAHKDKTYRENTWRLLQAGDPRTVAACVLSCSLPDRFDRKTLHEIYLRNADQVIKWWGDRPLSEQMPVLMEAYLYKARTVRDNDPAQAEAWLRKAAALTRASGIEKALTSSEFFANTVSVSHYDGVADDIQEELIGLRYSGIPGRAAEPDILKDRCQAVAAWPPAWKSPASADFDLKLICKMAYAKQFKQVLAPTSLPGVIDGVRDPLEP